MESSPSENDREDILESKLLFNRFFRDDLYGKYKNDENIILSRGAWEDSVIRMPEVFQFCLKYALDKHWTGYSHSLGHEGVFESLDSLLNAGKERQYSKENFGLTLGNVATIGFVFKQLKELFPEGEVVTMTPYYPPIVKSVNNHFKGMHFVSSLDEEGEIIERIREKIMSTPNKKLLLLSNCVGVEGRIFSKEFWKSVCELGEEQGSFLVIDEGLWFEKLEYPEEINSDDVIRVITPSKKYGIPGMKTGLMTGSKKFMEAYYDQASTNYGGPSSIFFLMQEFLYQFEHSLFTGTTEGVYRLGKKYDVDEHTMHDLYMDFIRTVAENKGTFESNKRILREWMDKNIGLFKKNHNMQGINCLLEPKAPLKGYELFEELITTHNVSVLPSSCLGDKSDSMFRVTVLEERSRIIKGLECISHYLETL